jgi:hypothetical protein
MGCCESKISKHRLSEIKSKKRISACVGRPYITCYNLTEIERNYLISKKYRFEYIDTFITMDGAVFTKYNVYF